MCFSVEADVAVGLLILPVAAAALLEVRNPRELPFAALPLVFALHQMVEALVWAGTEGQVTAHLQHLAAGVYLAIALPLLPTLVPLAVLLLEPRESRRRVLPFVVLGGLVSAYLAFVLLTEPFEVIAHSYGLEYSTGVRNGDAWAVLYVVAVIGPSLMSGFRSIVAFGLSNLIGLTAVTLLYVEAFTSLWCVYAATTSVFVLVHMMRRRLLPDAHRLDGYAVATSLG